MLRGRVMINFSLFDVFVSVVLVAVLVAASTLGLLSFANRLRSGER